MSVVETKPAGYHYQCNEHGNMSQKFDLIENHVRDLKYILIGIDGKNGLRSAVREILEDVEHLQEVKRDVIELNKLRVVADDYKKFKAQFMVVFLPLQGVLTAIVISLILKYLK